MDIKEILQERGTTHGNFTDNAAISQQFKDIIRRYDHKLSPVQKESLDMIVHKIARILAGNSDFKDHWDDGAGYFKLAAERIHTKPSIEIVEAPGDLCGNTGWRPNGSRCPGCRACC